MKECAIVSDLSGFGNCSIAAQLPILSAMGIRVHTLPSAVLSAQSEYENYTKFDLSEYTSKAYEDWCKLGARFDGVLAGYFTSVSQTEYVLKMVKNMGGILLVDPIMASANGRYTGFDDALCKRVLELSLNAQIITPNYYELKILTGKENIDSGARWLLDNGVKNVVVTGIREGKKIKNYVYTKKANKGIEANCYGGKFSGTGDIFAAVLFGYYLMGNRIFECVQYAADFVSGCAKVTPPGNENAGVNFESCLNKLTQDNLC